MFWWCVVGFGYTLQRLRPLFGANASSGYNLRPLINNNQNYN